MLQLKNITKDYAIGDDSVHALRGVDIAFRENEFVCILGPSGCGKTTLLNIVGGLDHYTDGDLVINGISTKQYKDANWDAYRNHSVGFVFQSYNLIPHQSVLSNVELALTVSGVTKKERHARAVEALTKVGLGDQIAKRPNQLSGGQMQRVAIARALVNNPDILLADEPTGALDSETSVQVMGLLKEISKDKLVIMVTHNPDLATTYASRIIRVLDGKVTDDSDPYTPAEAAAPAPVAQVKQKKPKNKSMRFSTAFTLSLNNLFTKKGRTLLTSFAGSIGIIGIALILSVSSGVQTYINTVQEDALSSAPISLQAESVSLTELISTITDSHDQEDIDHKLDAVYENQVMAKLMNSFNSLDTQKNDLKSFKEYIEKNKSTFDEYATAIAYSYGFDMNVYTEDSDGAIVKSDVTQLMQEMTGGNAQSSMNSMSSMGSMTSMDVWEQMLPEQDGTGINGVLKDQYDLVSGSWPENYNEIVIVVDKNNEINDLVLYALGLRTGEQIKDNLLAAQTQQQIDVSEQGQWSYDEIRQMTFKMIPSADCYQKQSDGTYKNLTETEAGLEYLYTNGNITIPLKVSGIIRPNEDATANMLSSPIGYTKALTDYIIERTDKNTLLQEQLASQDTDILTGLAFPTSENTNLSTDKKTAAVKAYIASMTTAQKAELYQTLTAEPDEATLNNSVSTYLASADATQLNEALVRGVAEQMQTDDETAASYVASMDEKTKQQYLTTIVTQIVRGQYAQTVAAQLSALTPEQIAAMLDAKQFTEADYINIYDNIMPATVSESTYDENLKALGYIDPAVPSEINLYAATFEDKDELAALISAYNKDVDEEKQISYTDYLALLLSGVASIINAISYVLIAFVAISLVVSSIMIGIITYISVLERTKEIGILRAIGASKKDVSRVFNAETLIVGFVSGAMGIGITLLLLIPINYLMHYLSDISTLNAILPVGGAVILVAISMLLTLVAGLIPSSVAAKKDPVEALRTE